MLNHKIIQRLMGELGLKSKIRWLCYRSYKGEVGKIAPNRKWATNVTQINIGLVKLYLSPILDMFTGEIISYNISRNPNLEQIYDMLDKTFASSTVLYSILMKDGNTNTTATVSVWKNIYSTKYVSQRQLP